MKQKKSWDDFFLGAIISGPLTAILGIILFANELKIEEAAKVLGPFITSAGFVLAAFVYYKNSEWRREDSQIEESAFYLEEATKGFSRAKELLADQNNDRATWLLAARLILEAKELEKNVSYDPHKIVLAIRCTEIRSALHQLLTVAGDVVGQRNPLPVAFFLGSSNWKSDDPLTAARKATSPIRVYDAANYQVADDPYLLYLAEESVHVVFEFMEYPKDYKDLIHSYSDRKPGDVAMPISTGEGAYQYLNFMEDHFVMMGMCYPRNADAATIKAEKERVEQEEEMRRFIAAVEKTDLSGY